MLSLLHVATAPVTFKLSPPSQQPPSCSPLTKCATFATVLADASDALAGNRPPVVICHFKGVNFPKTEAQHISFLTRSLPVHDSNDTGNNSAAHPNTSPSSTTSHPGSAVTTYPCSTFPVYGPFDLLYTVQTGGFGVAWAARDRSTGRLLCLKVIRSLRDPDVSKCVRAEIRAFRRMVKSKRGEKGRQFIMQLNRSIQHGDEVFFAMELMTTDLASYFSTEPENCKLHARRWVAQMALGIQSLHDMAIIHRDIKSENILIDPRENIRIIDFGLAYLDRLDEPLRQEGGKAFEFLGTPPYMAPEMLRNKGLSTDQRTRYGTAIDWWALGCILFELEAQDHQLLFDTEEDVHTYVAWTEGPCQPEQTYPVFEDLDPIVVNLLEGLLRVEPSSRYALGDVEKHDYFLRYDGTTEFDNAAARALERSVRPELVPRSPEDQGSDMVVEAAKPSLVYDWTNLKWAYDG